MKSFRDLELITIIYEKVYPPSFDCSFLKKIISDIGFLDAIGENFCMFEIAGAAFKEPSTTQIDNKTFNLKIISNNYVCFKP